MEGDYAVWRFFGDADQGQYKRAVMRRLATGGDLRSIRLLSQQGLGRLQDWNGRHVPQASHSGNGAGEPVVAEQPEPQPVAALQG